MTPDEAEARRKRSVTLLTRDGVPTNPHLPVIETADEIELPTGETVALRAIALAIVAFRGETDDGELTKRLVEEFRVSTAFTPEERAYIDANPVPERDRVRFSWRYEACAVLLWASGYLDRLGRPDHLTDVVRDAGIIRDHGRDRFVAEARLRSKGELLDAADLIYRYHWATREARLRGQEPPAGLLPGVVQERHYALNWLTLSGAWDEVETHT
jgi:hypothetical protein